jgi:hypothetical protein
MTGDPNPTLIISSDVAFDTIVVYNRQDCCQHNILGATITATVDGISQSNTFPDFENLEFGEKDRTYYN